MKLSALAHVLVASLVADNRCTPKDVRCNANLDGPDVCTDRGEWTHSVTCPPATFCKVVGGKPTCVMPFLAEVDVKAAPTCKPATYRCEANKRAWDVCNTSGNWEFAGRCPPGTLCRFNQANGSPYCLPRRTPTASDTIEVSDKCKPATYRCDPRRTGWDVCNTSGDWVFAGHCPFGTVCKFNKENNSPYCLPRGGFNAEIVMGDKGSEDDVEVGDVEVDVEVEL